MKSIGARVFSNLSRLKNLDLSECGIGSIDQDAFDDSATIKYLNLNKNQLKQFVTKCSPKQLNLSSNYDLELIKFIGSDLSNIEELYLNENTTLLKEFNSMFGGCEQVNIKNMRVNLNALDSDASFSQMRSLQILSIHRWISTKPVRISPSAFHGLTSLEHLELKFSFFDYDDEHELEEFSNNNLYKSGK